MMGVEVVLETWLLDMADAGCHQYVTHNCAIIVVIIATTDQFRSGIIVVVVVASANDRRLI